MIHFKRTVIWHNIFANMSTVGYKRELKFFLLSFKLDALCKDIIHLAYREITKSQFYAS